MATDMRERVTKYLTDAHSIEEQALAQLREAPEIAGEPELARVLREHERETEGHESRVRRLLGERGAEPSVVKDAAMRAGGSGFVLFARSQVDTPGKLAAHALSYEALEWASYDLLVRTAERAAEARVAEEARAIRDEERAMMERIEGLWDRTVDASLREGPDEAIEERLRTYLADAHAIEAQAIRLLESGKEMADAPALSNAFEEHLIQTRDQQARVEERLEALGGRRSLLKDTAMRMGAFNWGMFFRVQPDTTGKLAAFAYAFEHLEIGGYEQLRRVAARAGDAATVEAVEGILAEERGAAEMLAGTFDAAVDAAVGVTP